jgi:ATP-dependent protease HslVU (ClpYQ) ATPase subunit
MTMIQDKLPRQISRATALLTIIGIIATVAPASALAASATTNTSTGGTAPTAAQTARVKVIIGKGDQEIDRRLASLGKLSTKINAATKLTTSDKTSLTTQVNSEVNGLTNLKIKIDADTDLATTKTDVQSIFDEYRVYALIVPKVALVKVADDQQTTEAKLNALATKLQTALTAKKAAGKDVTSLQTQLTDMTTRTTSATAISTTIEASVINLQPSDYNSNHIVLSGDAAQLKIARSDNQAAYADSKSVAAGLKAL